MLKKNLLTLTICAVILSVISQAAYAQTGAFKITADDGAAHDEFGNSVSVSGDYFVVGARGDDDNGIFSGSAYVFKRSGSGWAQQTKLFPLKEDGSSDAELHDEFGRSVSISGDYLIVGAHRNDDNGSNSGSAYIFKRSGTSWAQEAKLLPSDGAAGDYFGWSVEISGDYAVVAAIWDDDNGTESGSAYVFKRSGTSWAQQAKLLPLKEDGSSDDDVNEQFGQSVSISGDYAVIGASRSDDKGTDSGSAYIFKRTGTSWAQQAKLLPSDGSAGDFFGYSVSISGDYAIVGAYNNDDSNGGTDAGSAYLFKRAGISWKEEAKLLPADGSAGDFFGYSVSIDGDYVVVGAQGGDDYGISSGSAYLFKRTSTSLASETKLLPSDGAFNDLFGYSVSISGYYAVVGAESDDDSGSASGSAFPFKRTSSSWTEETKLLPSDGAFYDTFGSSVSISVDYAVVGAPLDDDKGTDSGSAYIFKRTGKSGTEETKLTASDGAELDEFGVSAYLIGDFGSEASQCVTPPPDMVAWWPLDETSGTVAGDIAGLNGVGTYFGTPAPVTGKVDGALKFNGTTDYVEVADRPELNFGRGDFSIDAWVKTDISTGTRTVVDKRSGTNFNPLGYSLYIYNGYVGLQLAVKSGFYNYNNAELNSTSIADGQWHHIAVTVARNDITGLRIYIDGLLEHTKNPRPYNGSLDNTGVFRIASQSYVVDPDYMFTGVIDELELFNRVITPAEVRSIWSAGSFGNCKSPVSADEN